MSIAARTAASFRAMLHHDAGPRTVFFWAPAFKWALVVAGLSDLRRPVENVSVAQTTALIATGLIWSRYSMVIKPRNWLLFSVNIAVATTGLIQGKRIADWYRTGCPTTQIEDADVPQ